MGKKQILSFLLGIILLIAGCNVSSQNYLRKNNLKQLKGFAEENVWKIYDGNPVIKGDAGSWDGGALGSMSVLIVNDTLHLYYEAWEIRGEGWDHSDYASLHIGHATSVDGIHFVKDKNNPVIPRGEPGDFDFEGTWDPFVLYEDGIFKMWYGGGVRPNEIGYATSQDGSRFTKQKQISNNLRAVEDMHVVHDVKDQKYYMYYWHRAAKGGSRLLRAESKNETDFDFENPANVVIEGEIYPGRYKFTHVFKEKDKWYMFYSNFTPGIGCIDATVRFATSDDGVKWKMVNNYLLDGMDAEVLKVGKNLYVMYYGPQGYFDRADCDIRLAVYKGKLTNMPTRKDLVVLSKKQKDAIYTELAKQDLKKYIELYDLSITEKEDLFPILKEKSKSIYKITSTISGDAQKVALQKLNNEFELKINAAIGEK